MQIPVEVSSPVQLEAERRGIPVQAFVQQLIEHAMASLSRSASGGQDILFDAMDRIRALRNTESVTPVHSD